MSSLPHVNTGIQEEFHPACEKFVRPERFPHKNSHAPMILDPVEQTWSSLPSEDSPGPFNSGHWSNEIYLQAAEKMLNKWFLRCETTKKRPLGELLE